MAEGPRCVVDTNVLISAALSPRGTSNRVVTYVIEHGELLASAETFAELSSRLRTREKFRKYLSPEQIEGYLQRIRVASHFAEVTAEVQVCRDPDDDAFVALALSAGADYLITGNLRDFPTSPFRGLRILAPADFLERVGT